MREFVIPKSITCRDSRSLNNYLKEIDKIDQISSVDEVLLAKRIKEGDKDALERLTLTNLRFVVSVAKQYQSRGLTLCDLINEGNIGLITAAKRFDESRGFKFISYAVWWIRQSIISAIAEHSRTVRLPYNLISAQSKINKTGVKLEQLLGRRPSNEELADHLGIQIGKINEMPPRAEMTISIDEAFFPDSDFTMLDILQNNDHGTDHVVIEEAVKKEINQSLKVLSKRDRELLIMYFGLGGFAPLPVDEISKRMKITKEHVCRLKQKALGRLRNCSSAPVLISCLH